METETENKAETSLSERWDAFWGEQFAADLWFLWDLDELLQGLERLSASDRPGDPELTVKVGRALLGRLAGIQGNLAAVRMEKASEKMQSITGQVLSRFAKMAMGENVLWLREVAKWELGIPGPMWITEWGNEKKKRT